MVRAGVPQQYEFEICTDNPGPVPTSAGYALQVSRGLSALDAADTVITPGWLPVGALFPAAVRQALLPAHARGARLVTICSGYMRWLVRVYSMGARPLLTGRVSRGFVRSFRTSSSSRTCCTSTMATSPRAAALVPASTCAST